MCHHHAVATAFLGLAPLPASACHPCFLSFHTSCPPPFYSYGNARRNKRGETLEGYKAQRHPAGGFPIRGMQFIQKGSQARERAQEEARSNILPFHGAFALISGFFSSGTSGSLLRICPYSHLFCALHSHTTCNEFAINLYTAAYSQVGYPSSIQPPAPYLSPLHILSLDNVSVLVHHNQRVILQVLVSARRIVSKVGVVEIHRAT